MSSERKDEFGTTLEQLRKIQAATRACIRAIQDARNRAWEWRDRRDELRSSGPTVHDEISEQRMARDEINVQVQKLKQLRDEQTERARTLQEKLQALQGNRKKHGEQVPIDELQRRFRDLEWRQQTTTLSVDEERGLLTEMEEIIKAIELAKKIEQKPQQLPEEQDQIWQEIQNARDQAQEYHESMIALVDEAQQKHENIIELSQGIGPARKEIDEAHQMYVQCLQEADEMRERLEELKTQETELKKQLDGIRNRRRETRALREKEALERLAEQARSKQLSGEKLTIQELRALMETDGLG